jgi:hypothetical protein
VELDRASGIWAIWPDDDLFRHEDIVVILQVS